METKIPKPVISVMQEQHILIRIHPNHELELSDIIEINLEKVKYTEGKMHTVLFVPPQFGAISKEAREYSASKEVYHNAIAKAIVINSLSSRIIGNIFIKVNNPPAPTKLFKTEIEATLWLNEMRENYFKKEK